MLGSFFRTVVVPLLPAVPEPSSSMCVMQWNAEDHKLEFSPDVVSTVMKNFYIDDCLKSLPLAGVTC